MHMRKRPHTMRLLTCFYTLFIPFHNLHPRRLCPEPADQ
uniref:Uncharacterized protein n=1 Tax=Anguilla anguilla TaxID=7936 RepID=A0A0E9W2F3_ANGAN